MMESGEIITFLPESALVLAFMISNDRFAVFLMNSFLASSVGSVTSFAVRSLPSAEVLPVETVR